MKFVRYLRGSEDTAGFPVDVLLVNSRAVSFLLAVFGRLLIVPGGLLPPVGRSTHADQTRCQCVASHLARLSERPSRLPSEPNAQVASYRSLNPTLPATKTNHWP